MLTFKELTSSSNDLDVLKNFYETVYIRSFPDAHERESLENMSRYLELKQDGWYRENNYHILLAFLDEKPVGASVTDYFSIPNIGVIEFLFVSPEAQGIGAGKKLLQETEILFERDAHKAGHSSIKYIMAEMNDPFLTDPNEDNMNPFVRAALWGKWGFSALDFPYTQPALDADKKSVDNLIIICREPGSESTPTIKSSGIEQFLHDYMYWAMRIQNPPANPDYKKMQKYLRGREEIPQIPLLKYTGDNLRFTDVTGEEHPDWLPTIQLYESVFSTREGVAVPAGHFATLLRSADESGYSYHVSAIRLKGADQPIQGMASIFKFGDVGFIGYVTLSDGLRGQGLFRQVLAGIERTLLSDCSDTRGVYAECERGHMEGVLFRHLGFWKVDVDYRQPGLPTAEGEATGSALFPLELLYKPIGRNYDSPQLSPDEFLGDIQSIYRIVYELPDPDISPEYQHILASVTAGVQFTKDL